MKARSIKIAILGFITMAVMILSAVPASGLDTYTVTVSWEADSNVNTTNVPEFGQSSDYYILLKMVNQDHVIVSTRTLSSTGSSTTFSQKSDYLYVSVNLINRYIEQDCTNLVYLNSLCDDYTIVVQKLYLGDDMAGKYFMRPYDESGYFPIAATVGATLYENDLVEVSIGTTLYVPYLRIINNHEVVNPGGGGGPKYLCGSVLC